MSQAYKDSGVDIHAGYSAVQKMKTHVERTKRAGVLGALGGFGGAFDLSALDYKEPVLISGTDGVGTKLMLAIEQESHSTIGIDAVAMCVNDIVTQGAEPLYFLDYIACGHLEPEKIEAIVSGIADGCEQAGCAIVGGETAEMPGMYEKNDYDIAGFSVGAVEKTAMLDGSAIADGDVLIGLASSGVHSNGFSLIRKIITDKNIDLNQRLDNEAILGEALLEPTRIYVKPILNLLNKRLIKGASHITGGGLIENVPRMLPEGLTAAIDTSTWSEPDIFKWLRDVGNLSNEDIYETFNMGIGMVLAIHKDDVDTVLQSLKQDGETAYVIGQVSTHTGRDIEILRGEK